MHHTLLRAHQHRCRPGAHVRIGIAGHHPQAIERGRGRPPHRQDISKQIATELAISPATVSRIEPVRRYERENPGDLIHIDIKKLVKFEGVGHRITGDRRGQGNYRGIGWEFVHVCIDDASRIAFVQIMPDASKQSAVAFLRAAVGYYESLGVKVARVMTDNGGCYRALAYLRPNG